MSQKYIRMSQKYIRVSKNTYAKIKIHTRECNFRKNAYGANVKCKKIHTQFYIRASILHTEPFLHSRAFCVGGVEKNERMYFFTYGDPIEHFDWEA